MFFLVKTKEKKTQNPLANYQLQLYQLCPAVCVQLNDAPQRGHVPITWLFGINCPFHQVALD